MVRSLDRILEIFLAERIELLLKLMLKYIESLLKIHLRNALQITDIWRIRLSNKSILLIKWSRRALLIFIHFRQVFVLFHLFRCIVFFAEFWILQVLATVLLLLAGGALQIRTLHLWLKIVIEIIVIARFRNDSQMLEKAKIVFVTVAILAHQFDLVIGQGHLFESFDDFVDPEKVLQRSHDVVGVVELVVLHLLSKKHVRLAVDEAVHQHVNGVLVRHHRVLYAVEDQDGALHLLCNFKIVKPFVQQQIDNSSVVLASDVFHGFDGADEDECAAVVEFARQVARRSRANGSTHNDYVAFRYLALVSKEFVQQLRVAQNLLRSLLLLRVAIGLLVQAVARIFYAHDAKLQLLVDLFHQLLRVADVLSVRVKMKNDIVGSALEKEAWYKVRLREFDAVLLLPRQLLLFLQQAHIVLEANTICLGCIDLCLAARSRWQPKLQRIALGTILRDAVGLLRTTLL